MQMHGKPAHIPNKIKTMPLIFLAKFGWQFEERTINYPKNETKITIIKIVYFTNYFTI